MKTYGKRNWLSKQLFEFRKEVNGQYPVCGIPLPAEESEEEN